ncbi:MAG TPA: dihydroorotate dehydrogenase [Myxococcota bacterium]|nr:dihydroorotate dehydrogenase [Myxococcota bacterium]
MSAADLSVAIGRLRLDNPVMVAAGTFGFGEEYAGLLDVDALGALVTKGISLQPRRGNPPPRTVETPAGMLNSVGLENPGLESFIENKMPWLRSLRTAVIVNIFGSTADEYAELAGRLDAVEGIAALEVNISCPNVKRGGMAFGADPDIARQVAKRVLDNTRLPVLVKLTPNVTDIAEVAKRVASSGVDGLTLINTLSGMALDYRTGKPLLGNVIGGLSGPAIRPVAVRAVYEVARAVDIPLVGCGGICRWQDAVEFMRAGATAVQVGSATFRVPRTALECLQGVDKFLTHGGYTSVSELVGHVESVTDKESRA